MNLKFVNFDILSSTFLLVMPSADNSCILVQAETIFIERVSTTITLYSILPGVLLWPATVAQITSFINWLSSIHLMACSIKLFHEWSFLHLNTKINKERI